MPLFACAGGIRFMDINPEWIQSLFEGAPVSSEDEAALKRIGFDDAEKAWKTLGALSDQANFRSLFPDFFPALLELISHSYNADLALTNFERFADKIYDKNYLYTLLMETPDLLEALIVLFSGSQILTDTLLKDPSHFDWLKQADVLNKLRSKDALMRDFHDMSEGNILPGGVPGLLRRFKKREYIRIGLRDLLGKSEMQETVEDISNLADVCLQIAYEYANRECGKKYGIPFYQDADGNAKVSEFTILGMGKLGGSELNFSSDIDLIYIYTSSMGETRPEEGASTPITRLSNHEYFTKLAQLITKTIHEITPEGNVFRVDLDLRPEGRSGEIVNSLTSCEVYYQSWGRTWERQALLKARACAGSLPLGERFFSALSPFIYRRSLDFSAIEEIKAMKNKINVHIKNKKTGKGDIKLGFGGIREVEFTVQAYQLLFGGRDESLRVIPTLKLMKRLQACGYLTPDDYENLSQAYIFLRNLENRVQISFGLQTHVLPDDETQLAVLARKMRLPGDRPEALVKNLLCEFDRHTQFVGTMFANLFVEKTRQEATEIASREQERRPLKMELLAIDYLREKGFSDPRRVARFLESLRDGPQFSHPSEKSIQEFYSALPRILDLSADVPRPDSAIENLVKFIEASGARETYLGLLNSSGQLLELLIILFGSSDLLSQTLIKQPDLVDVFMDLESIYRFKPPEKINEDWTRVLKSCKDMSSKKIVLRRFKLGEELRIGIRYLIKEADLMGTLADLSFLAEMYLQIVTDLAYDELSSKSPSPLPNDFAIFGLGKLGGRELNFGSDLDIIFVYDEPESEEPALSQADLIAHYMNYSRLIYQLTSEMTSAGYAYKVDTDLRPDGSRGDLIISVKGYEEYFKSRAKIWEQQAMTRVRFVAGNAVLGEKFLKIAHEFTYRKKFEYGSLIEISRLRERMEKELAAEHKKGKNIKLGFGGLVDIEFTLQILQMMHGYQNPRLRQTNMVEVLDVVSAHGLLDQAEAGQMAKHYFFLRNLECALRLINRSSSNYLPKDKNSLSVLARLLGYEEKTVDQRAEALSLDYGETTREVRKFYRKMLDTWLRTAL
jgi:[glutamine synthetase] adenylyltransferase / [glutamine synthetase]-adenylyl-L-tyrosine phosphorylase